MTIKDIYKILLTKPVQECMTTQCRVYASINIYKGNKDYIDCCPICEKTFGRKFCLHIFTCNGKEGISNIVKAFPSVLLGDDDESK